MRMRRAIGRALCGLVLLATPLRADDLVDRVLAVVGSTVITASDVHMARTLGRVRVEAAPDPVRAAADQLIDRALILAEVDRFAPPEPSPDALDEAYASVVVRHGGGTTFGTMLTRLGLDEAQIRALLREDLRMRAYLDQRFAADTAEAQQLLIERWVVTLRSRTPVVLREPLLSGPATASERPAAR